MDYRDMFFVLNSFIHLLLLSPKITSLLLSLALFLNQYMTQVILDMDSSIGQCNLTNPYDVNAPAKSFTFDGAYYKDSTTEQIYNEIVFPLVEVRHSFLLLKDIALYCYGYFYFYDAIQLQTFCYIILCFNSSFTLLLESHPYLVFLFLVPYLFLSLLIPFPCFQDKSC